MNKKIIIPIVVAVLLIIIGILFFPFGKKEVSTITLDINPSIELNLSKDNEVLSVKAINDDAKEIINNVEGKTLSEAFTIITKNLYDKGYLEDREAIILIHSSGDITNNEIEKELRNSLEKEGVHTEIYFADNITKEDEELAKKYNITPAKANYINAITKEYENITPDQLIDKPIGELLETKGSGLSCEEGYSLEGGVCLKEKERINATTGDVCPDGYYEYNSKCYDETRILEGDKEVCNEGLTLENGVCTNTTTYKAEGVCENGEYRSDQDKCTDKVYIGDATEFCRDPGRTLYEHKCLATKPTINGGCLGSDKLLNGKCVNTIDDYYASEYKCPNGQMNSNADGSLLYPDNKCYEEKLVDPKEYKCNKDFTLKGKECVITTNEKPRKEQYCPDGYTTVDFGRCINLNKEVKKESGFVCNTENSRLRGDVCIIYDVKDAIKN